MATQTVICDLSYRGVGTSSNYSTARATMSSSTNGQFELGQLRSSNYSVYRQFLRFPTSTLPAGAVVSSAKLRLVATNDFSAFDFNVLFVAGGATPPAESDWDAALTTSPTYAWRNTSGMSVNTQYLSSSDLPASAINAGGYTYLTLLSDRDRNGTINGSEYFYLATYVHATESYRPALVVEYTLPSLPSIIWWS